MDLFYSQGFGIVSQLPGYEDGYYNNWLYTTSNGGDYGGGQTCSGGAATIVVRAGGGGGGGVTLVGKGCDAAHAAPSPRGPLPENQSAHFAPTASYRFTSPRPVQLRAPPSHPTLQHDNTIWTPPGAKGVTECGKPLAQWQAQGGDPGTTVATWPDDSVVIAQARQLLGLTA